MDNWTLKMDRLMEFVDKFSLSQILIFTRVNAEMTRSEMATEGKFMLMETTT